MNLLMRGAIGTLFLAAASASATEVTVYNQDLGLVRETRSFALKAGMVNDVRAADVAARIDPTSVHFKSLTSPGGIAVLEQNFEYDLISQEKLLERYLGKDIELERFLGTGGEKREVIAGKLLSTTGGTVLASGGKLYLNPPGNPVLPELPEGLLTRPTLAWRVESRSDGNHDCEISYLTSGMSWRSDYVLVASPGDDKLDLNAWVTIENNSGATYKDAKLKLVAGDVHRAEPAVRPMMYAAKAMRAAAEDSAGFGEKSFFEYHLYTLQRRTTVRDRETKQIELASAAGVPLRKLYIYQGSGGFGGDYNEYTRSNPAYGLEAQKKVDVVLEFKNSKEGHLGMPLPKGKVRVYKQDTDGSLEFIGEDEIDHTPKDEKVRVSMGHAFDVVGERTRLSYESDVNKRWMEETFQIKLRNHKDVPVDVTAVERLYRWTNWKILDASMDWKKKDAQTIEFNVPVSPDAESVVTYTVKYSW